MSGFDKVIKGACKPKAAPPKSKYLEPILAATWSEDGAVGDVCRALSPKFREPNAIVVFKALIVLHTMIRNGATDNVLAYLSSTDVLRLRNVGAGHWEGYNAPQNLQHYAIYIDTRIRAYRDMKHDAIRVQSENNRDHRLSQSIEDDGVNRNRGSGASGASSSTRVQRSKTLLGKKLRVMSVEKGLLRETKAVQKQIDSLVECRFYLDDLDDELTITALRMLVKDLVILFQAGNEGMVNVLEHFFEMSHVDAEQALALYRHFCKQTERVVDYLGVAKKLANLLNVPIPNMKHAPVSLAGALEEYLTDSNFEQNRIEYKTQRDSAEKNVKQGPALNVKKAISADASSTIAPSASSSSTETVKPEPKQAVIDFFSTIEEEQQTMFNPQTGSPTSNYFQQQAAHNPFVHQQMTNAFPSQPFGQPQAQMQPTGFIQPQHTAFNPFSLQPPQQQMQQQQQSMGAPNFMQSQATGFLQPQATGANPFRQSMLVQQSTGFPPFGMGGGMPNFGASSSNTFPMQSPSQAPAQGSTGTAPSPFSVPPSISTTSSTSSNASSAFSNSTPFASPMAQPFASNGASSSNLPTRPSTAPLSSQPSASTSGSMQPVKSHQTGSRNPFGVPVTPAPPLPQPPTLMELMMGSRSGSSDNTSGTNQQQQPQQTGLFNGLSGLNGLGSQDKSDISSVASSFSNAKVTENKTGFSGLPAMSPTSSFGSSLFGGQNTSNTTGSTFSGSSFSSLSSQPTGATMTSTTSAAPSISVSPPLKPHTTGFSGVKAFKPSSSFGAQLLESLPSIPQSAPSTPKSENLPLTSPSMSNNNSFANGLNSQQTGFGTFNAQPTGAFPGLTSFSATGGGSQLGVGLRAQMTGSGAANPFRASMISSSTMPAPTGGPFSGAGPSFGTASPSAPGLNGSSFGASLFSQPTGAASSTPSFGASLFGGNSQQTQSQQQQQHQQQNGSASLI